MRLTLVKVGIRVRISHVALQRNVQGRATIFYDFPSVILQNTMTELCVLLIHNAACGSDQLSFISWEI